MRIGRFTVFLCLCAIAFGQSDPIVKAVRQYREAHEHGILRGYMDLLAIPNVAADPENLRRNAAAIVQLLRQRGVSTRLLELQGVPPVVYGELLKAGATRTILFYAHYDGSPVDAKEWMTPPFEPVLRSAAIERDGQIIALPKPGTRFDPEWRVYSRSAGDDKAPVIALVTALDALRAAGREPTVNVKFVFEGEEEAGSEHLEAILAQHKALLKSDVWLICDGPIHQTRMPQIVFGARGVATATLTVYGARRELHSGHYGNWSPNPAMMLAQLLASMKDSEGNILIEGFYDGVEPLSAIEKKAIAEIPNSDEQLKKELWLGRADGNGRSLAELINLPSLNIRGLSSSRTGSAATNVIPATATAAIDMRLVRGISHDQAVARLKAHIVKQGYVIVNTPPDAAVLTFNPRVLWFKADEFGYDAVRTPMDLPISEMVLRAAARAKQPIIKAPTLGGSLPLFMIERSLGANTIVTPLANHDNNQHSFNENIRLQNLWDGIELMAAFLTMQ